MTYPSVGYNVTVTKRVSYLRNTVNRIVESGEEEGGLLFIEIWKHFLVFEYFF